MRRSVRRVILVLSMELLVIALLATGLYGIVYLRKPKKDPEVEAFMVQVYGGTHHRHGQDKEGAAIVDAALSGEPSTEVLIRALKYHRPESHEPAARVLGLRRESSAIDALIEAMQQSKGNSDQGWCAWALGKIGDRRAVEPLIGILDSRQWSHWQVAEALGVLGDERAVEPLLEFVAAHKVQLNMRQAYLDALVQLGQPTVDAIVAAAQCDDKPFDLPHADLVWLFEEIGGRTAEGYFDGSSFPANLRRPENDTYAYPLAKLGSLEGIAEVEETAARSYEVREVSPYAIECLLGQKERTREALYNLLRGDKSGVVIYSSRYLARDLADASDPRAWELLVRTKQYDVLKRLGTPAIQPILDKLGELRPDDSPYHTRYDNLIEVLGKIGNKGARPALRRLVDEGISYEAAYVLAVLDDKEIIETLREWLAEGDLHQKDVAVRGLGVLKDKDAFERILAIATTQINEEDIDPNDRESRSRIWRAKIDQAHAIDALGMIGDERAIEPLSAMLEECKSNGSDKRYGFRDMVEDGWSGNIDFAVTLALGRILPEGSRDLLHDCLDAKNGAVVQGALYAIMDTGDTSFTEDLVKRIQVKGSYPEYSIFKVLASLKDNRCVPHLADVLVERHKFDRDEIVGILGDLGDPRAAPALATILKEYILDWGAVDHDFRSYFQRLVWIERNQRDLYYGVPIAYARCAGKDSIELLAIALDSPSWEIRLSAARALGMVGDEAASDYLIRAMKDKVWCVRESAVWSLRQIGDNSFEVKKAIVEAESDCNLRVRMAAKGDPYFFPDELKGASQYISTGSTSVETLTVEASFTR